jgi:hypothetical protein
MGMRKKDLNPQKDLSQKRDLSLSIAEGSDRKERSVIPIEGDKSFLCLIWQFVINRLLED